MLLKLKAHIIQCLPRVRSTVEDVLDSKQFEYENHTTDAHLWNLTLKLSVVKRYCILEPRLLYDANIIEESSIQNRTIV